MTMDEVMDLAVDEPAAGILYARLVAIEDKLERSEARYAAMALAAADVVAGLDRLAVAVEGLVRRVERVEELPEDLEPLVQGVTRVLVDRLDDLERDGTLAFLREGVGVAATVARSFSPEDVRLLGDNVVTILHTVRALTQPEILEMADRAASALRSADARSKRPPGLVRSLRDPDVRRGLALMLTVLGEVGHENGETIPVHAAG